MANNTMLRHWPTALLGTLVALVLLTAVFSYQVGENELAVVTTLGKVEDYQPEPGLHFRWPYPIQEIHRFDGRDPYRADACGPGLSGGDEAPGGQDPPASADRADRSVHRTRHAAELYRLAAGSVPDARSGRRRRGPRAPRAADEAGGMTAATRCAAGISQKVGGEQSAGAVQSETRRAHPAAI